MQLLTLEKKDPMVKARLKIQKSIYKSIPKVPNGVLVNSAQKKIPLVPLTASNKKQNTTFQTLEKKRLQPLNISSFDFEDKPYESASKPSRSNQLDFKSLKKYKNQFETVANEPMHNSIDAQTVFENQRHRSLNVSHAAPEKRRNIMIKQNDGNSRNTKGFEPGTSRFKDNRTTINQGSGSQPFQSSDATAPSEMPSDGITRGARAAELHMKVMQS
jgi:hypothetical protein